MILWDAKTKKLYGLNGSGRSPYNMKLEDLKAAGLSKIPLFGPLSISVPGCVDGWFTLHERFGKIPMNNILEPAIRYANDGFPVSEQISYDWQSAASRLRDMPGFADVFMPNGEAPVKGHILKIPPLEIHSKR